jgi:hypothetical protein
VCKWYISLLNDILKKEDIYMKFNQIYSSAQQFFLPADIRTFEELDGIILQALYTVESKCSKFKKSV